MPNRIILVAAVACLLVGEVAVRADCTLTSTGKTPLNDLGVGTYLGSMGGLYPGGTSIRPAAHAAAGLLIAQNEIVPRDGAGNVDLVNGRIVLISVGMSNTQLEFATGGPGAFLPRIDADTSKNSRLVVVSCAKGNRAVAEWRDPANDAWSTCLSRLSAAGVTPGQVQAAWVKLAERTSDVPDQSFPAHALFHQPRLGEVLRLLTTNFPHLRLAFMTSRTRAYEDNPASLNPEPFSYEENFSVKWLIQDQINGVGNLNYDPNAGPVVAPYIVWGPYIWTDGEVPRSDGFVWHCSDVVADFTHPSDAGTTKVADQLFAFFKTDPLSTSWFLRTSVTGQPPSGQITADIESGPAPLTVQFTGGVTDPDGSIVETAWTFDDGGYSMDPNPTKTFLWAGTYVVRMTATDNDGNPVKFSKIITVTTAGAPIPTASACGVGAMGLLVLALGMMLLRRSRAAPSPAPC